MSVINPAAIIAIARRQLGSFLTSPLGYVFILAFVVLFGAVTFGPEAFYKRNIADFGLTYAVMPWALAVLVPALVMTAWSSERENGTEELLLTLPLSILDAVLGKYLAVAAFFTIALLCNLCNVAMLAWLGDPDMGLVFANFIGWWLYGLALCGVALLGSVQVGSSAIAFVVGLIYCLVVAALTWRFDLLRAFDRGVFPISLLLLAGVVVIVGVAGSVFQLASRRWHPSDGSTITNQVVSLVLALIIAVNLAGLSQRWYVDADLSSEGLSSISAHSKELLGDVQFSSEVHVFITAEEVLPDQLEQKAQEVLDKAAALERASAGTVQVTIHRPKNQYDELGTLATETYGLRTREVPDDTVMGSEMVPVFLGAVVTCNEQVQRIDYFEAGLSVEYELVRAVRAVNLQADIRPNVTVTIYHSPDLPETQAPKLAALKSWAEARADRSDLTITFEAVSDLKTAPELGLEVQSIQVQKAAEPAAADAEAPAEGAEAAPEAEPESEAVEIVLGAVARSERYESRVKWFDEADDAVADLGEAIRKARRAKAVVAVLESDLKMNGEYTQQGQLPRWPLLDELERDYEIRSIEAEALDPRELDDIDMLLAPLPSSLTPEGLERLHDWIWAGRPTLMMVDPHPIFPMASGRIVAPAAPKQLANGGNPFMQQQQPTEEKAGVDGMRTLFRALGVQGNLDEVYWSSYQPSYQMNHLGPEFLWISDDQGAIAQHPTTLGVGAVLLPYAGAFRPRSDATTEIRPIFGVTNKHSWGMLPWSQHVSVYPFPQQLLPTARQPDLNWGAPDMPVLVAAEISGVMERAYGGMAERGAPSEQPIKVIVIADTDLAHGQFFNLYRNYSSAPGEGLPPELARLRNVQWMQNAIDYLLDDPKLIPLRARRSTVRTLTTMDEKRDAMRAEMIGKRQEVEEEARLAKQRAETQVREKIEEIMAEADLDRRSKEEKRQYHQEKAQAKLEARIAKIDENAKRDVEKLENEMREGFLTQIYGVRILVLAIPAALLLALVFVVSGLRMSQERTDIPEARDRRKS